MLRGVPLIALGACAHDPAPELCPDVAAGDLVVTELRGEQSGADSWGQWIEVQNRTGAAIDLEGLVIDLKSIDGSTQLRMLVRAPVEVPALGHAALGRPADGAGAAHLAYDLGADLDASFPSSGGVTLLACGAETDQVVFNGLPTMGTWALDDGGTWCADTTPGDDTTMLGVPGTPGAPNRPCP